MNAIVCFEPGFFLTRDYPTDTSSTKNEHRIWVSTNLRCTDSRSLQLAYQLIEGKYLGTMNKSRWKIACLFSTGLSGLYGADIDAALNTVIAPLDMYAKKNGSYCRRFDTYASLCEAHDVHMEGDTGKEV